MNKERLVKKVNKKVGGIASKEVGDGEEKKS